jgi:thiamine-phosphate pyrophosphorylase
MLSMALVDRFIAARLYAITCSPPGGSAGYLAMARAACEGGVDVIQFRDKTLSGKEKYEAGRQLRKICAEFNVLFIVNDAVDLALAVRADGVHLGQDDLPLPVVKELVRNSGRKEFLVGKSTHTLAQALEAEREGADYIGIGPVYATPTKPAYNAVGLELVRQLTRVVKTPHVAIGGIHAENVKAVLQAGAQRIAVVRAICGAPDIKAAAQTIKKAMES